MSLLVSVDVRANDQSPTITVLVPVSSGATEMRNCGDGSFRYLTDGGADLIKALLPNWQSMEVLAPENLGQRSVKRTLRRTLESVQAVFE